MTKINNQPALRIVGIDPGSNKTGVAYISSTRLNPYSPKDFKLIDVLTLTSKAGIDLNDRVYLFHESIYKLMQEFKPTHCAIETCFVGVNVQSALKLGLIRGAIISAVKRLQIPIIEIAPTKVKKIITGNGHAKKEEMATTLKALMGFNLEQLSYDASDALAIALSSGLSLQENAH